MSKISFTRSIPWHDRNGKHTVIEILDGKRIIGKIKGDSWFTIKSMEYAVTCEHLDPFQTFSLNEAKAKVLIRLSIRTRP